MKFLTAALKYANYKTLASTYCKLASQQAVRIHVNRNKSFNMTTLERETNCASLDVTALLKA
jgi:hypothetical protein